MIHIITDSMSDLLPQEAAPIGVEVLAQPISFGQESLLDNVTISREEFYRRLEIAESLPKTSQVPPESFFNAYQRALSNGSDVLAITGSSELSGTYQSAVIARDMLEEKQRAKIFLVDTLSGSLGESLLVYEAAKLRDAGESASTIQKALLTLIPYQTLVGQVDDLKYLVMGGRLSSVGARVGTMLHLKPMIKLKAGKLEMGGLARGTRKALEWLSQQLKEIPPDPAYPVHFACANAPKALDALKAYLLEKGMLPPVIRTLGIGSIVGTHTGPGCIAMSWIKCAKGCKP